MTNELLLIADDPSQAEPLTNCLRQAGYQVVISAEAAGLAQAQRSPPEIAVVDAARGGLALCRSLRSNPPTSRVLILVIGESADELAAFSSGADDYIARPYSLTVLVERVRALERRPRSTIPEPDVVSRAGIIVDRRRHTVTVQDSLVNLTPSEFRLLETLIREPDRVFSRTELMRLALGEDALVTERTIDVHIRGLRKKLGDAAQAIGTVRRGGYFFQAPSTGSG